MSNELKFESSEQVIKSNNTEIIFKLRKKEINQKGKEKEKEKNNIPLRNSNIIYIGENIVRINNISNKYVALRVRTTKKNYYTVEPIYVIINPNSFVDLKIFCHSNPNEKINLIGNKFKFEGFIIDDKDKNCKNIFDLFQRTIKNNIKVKGNSIIKYVKFINDNNEYSKQIKECEEIRKEYKTLINELIEIKRKNEINIKDYFNVGKELIVGIKNNKFQKWLLFILFILSIILGVYLNR